MNGDYKELVEYLDEKFNNIDERFNKVEGEFGEFKNEMLSFKDQALKDLEDLKQEKVVGDAQDKRKTRVLQIHNDALKTGKILSDNQVAEINGLQAF